MTLDRRSGAARDATPCRAFRATPTARCFASLGRRRPSRWRWRCTSAACSPGPNGRGAGAEIKRAQGRAIPTPARPITGIGWRRWNTDRRKGVATIKPCIATATPGTTPPTARRTARRSNWPRMISNSVKSAEPAPARSPNPAADTDDRKILHRRFDQFFRTVPRRGIEAQVLPAPMT